MPISEGTIPVMELLIERSCRASLPCEHCKALSGCYHDDGNYDYEHLAGHNILKLEEELLAVRQAIRSENIREYIERQVRVAPNLTAALRLLDQEHNYIEARTPQHRRSIFYANTAESLQRADVTRFAERVLTRYTAQKAMFCCCFLARRKSHIQHLDPTGSLQKPLDLTEDICMSLF